MDRDVGRFGYILYILSKAALFIAAAAVLFLTLHVTIDVIAKYLFNSPLSGTIEISSHYYMIMIVFLPLAFIEFKKEAISVDFLYLRFPEKLQYCCILFALAISTIVFAGLCYRSIFDALRATSIGELAMGFAEIQIWPARWALPVGYGLAALVCCWHIVRLLQGKDKEGWIGVKEHQVNGDETI